MTLELLSSSTNSLDVLPPPHGMVLDVRVSETRSELTLQVPRTGVGDCVSLRTARVWDK